MSRSSISIALVLVSIFGCGPPSFRVKGKLTSESSIRRNSWRSAPQGCTRDPFDAQPADKSTSILTLLWEDPGARDPTVDNHDTAPDAPMRLEFSRVDTGPQAPVAATLHTRYKAGIPLGPNVCTTFRLATQQQPAQAPYTRPSLSGELALDCEVNDSRLTANLHFEHCEY